MVQLENIKENVLIRDRVYEALRKEILSGGFAPGESLNILGISKQMGVSCAPIREALNMLNKDGLVELMPYKKAIVANGTEKDFEVTFALRTMLEPYALSQSIDAIPQKEIDEMRGFLQQMYQSPGTLEKFYDSDNMFHQFLYAYVDSKLLYSQLDNVRTYTVRYYAKRFEMILQNNRKSYPGGEIDINRTIREQTAEHLAILDAIDKRDRELATALLKKHISTMEA